MPRFRKKPVVIEAVRVSDFNRCDSPSWVSENAPLWLIEGMENLTLQCAPDGIYVKTVEGTMKANLDDWIIRGVKGELYPCKPDIFAATYEAAPFGVTASGSELIATERQRQIEAEGWTPAHDDGHCGKEMALAAMAYLQSYVFDLFRPLFWPWSPEWWKPKDHRSNLVRAGALIAAELDRLQRLDDAEREKRIGPV